MTDAIYVAGPLNAEAVDYIQNLYSMNLTAAEVEHKGASVFIPGNDIIYGIWHGGRKYEDYFRNSIEWLRRADALYLSPNWENSKGTKREIAEAQLRGIPVFEDLESLERFLGRPKILCIVGESGTGKTEAAKYIEEAYGIPMLRSYTDREPREDDDSHVFLSKEEFDEIPYTDMIVPTNFGSHRYCCRHGDVTDKNSYVITEDGYMTMKLAFKARYRVQGLRLLRLEELRINSVGAERIERDQNRFLLPASSYDYVFNNSSNDIGILHNFIDGVMEEFNE